MIYVERVSTGIWQVGTYYITASHTVKCTCIGFLTHGYCKHVRLITGLKLTDVKGVGEKTAEKLREIGVETVEQLASKSPEELRPIFGSKAEEVIEDAKNLTSTSIKLRDALNDFNELKNVRGHITTGSKALDKAIDPCGVGGIETHAVSSIYGAYGSGKTQLAHQLVVNAQLPTSLGGLKVDKPVKVAYIETEVSTIRHERINQMALAKGLIPEEVLSNIYVFRALGDVSEQFAAYEKIHQIAVKENIKLVCIDSFSAKFREVFVGRGTYSSRAQELAKHLEFLNRIAYLDGCAIVLTHQVYEVPEAYGARDEIIWGGHMVKHGATLHLHLKRVKAQEDGMIVEARVVDHPSLPTTKIQFVVKEKGVSDV